MYTIQYRSIVLVFFFFHIWMYVINPPHRIKVDISGVRPS